MINDLKYMIDDSGNKTSVLVPIKLWEDLNNNYRVAMRKLEILNGIKKGLQEVKTARKNGTPLQTLNDFLK